MLTIAELLASNTRTISVLHLTCLDQERHAGTCGYWYTVTAGGTPLTAFRTKDALVAWTAMLKLTIEGTLPEKTGTRANFTISGHYYQAYKNSWAQLVELEGLWYRALSNSDYRKGKVCPSVYDLDALLLAIPVANCSPVLDYKAAQGHIDKGEFII